MKLHIPELTAAELLAQQQKQQAEIAQLAQMKIEQSQSSSSLAQPLYSLPVLQPQLQLPSPPLLIERSQPIIVPPHSLGEFSLQFPRQGPLLITGIVFVFALLYALFASGCMRRTCWLLVGKGGLRSLFRKCLRRGHGHGQGNTIANNVPIELIGVREQNDGVSPRTQTTYKLC